MTKYMLLFFALFIFPFSFFAAEELPFRNVNISDTAFQIKKDFSAGQSFSIKPGKGNTLSREKSAILEKELARSLKEWGYQHQTFSNLVIEYSFFIAHRRQASKIVSLKMEFFEKNKKLGRIRAFIQLKRAYPPEKLYSYLISASLYAVSTKTRKHTFSLSDPAWQKSIPKN